MTPPQRTPRPSDDYRKRLRRARKEIKLTITELGTMVGLSAQAVSQLELEKQHATLPTLQSLADAVGVHIGWLVTGQGEMWQDESSKGGTKGLP